MKKRILLFLLALAVGFTSCKDDDPCGGISCLNGGTCANGACNCPTGFEGSDCSQQTTPARIHLTSIRVLQFPPLKANGDSWDLFDGADVYVSLALSGNEIANNRSAFIEDAALPPLSWSLSTAFVLDEPTNQYSLGIFDKDDFGTDEFMSGINFTPYYSTNHFPEKDTISCSNCPVVFEVTYNYDF